MTQHNRPTNTNAQNKINEANKAKEEKLNQAGKAVCPQREFPEVSDYSETLLGFVKALKALTPEDITTIEEAFQSNEANEVEESEETAAPGLPIPK
jgi:hypothetical protein